jgi:hypothetical protein
LRLRLRWGRGFELDRGAQLIHRRGGDQLGVMRIRSRPALLGDHPDLIE